MDKEKYPTTDCDGCGKEGFDDDGNFDCAWKPLPRITVTDEGRCLHVVQIEKIYNEAVANRKRKEQEQQNFKGE